MKQDNERKMPNKEENKKIKKLKKKEVIESS